MEKEINKTGIGYLINLIRNAIDSKYSKPATGIPIEDLNSTLSQSINNKANKASSANEGNIAGLDSLGNVTDSGIAANKVVVENYEDINIGTLSNFIESNYPYGVYNITYSNLYSSLEQKRNSKKIPTITVALNSHNTIYTIPLTKDSSGNYVGIVNGRSNDYYVMANISQTSQTITIYGFYKKPSSGIPKSDLTGSVQSILNNSIQVGDIINEIDN